MVRLGKKDNINKINQASETLYYYYKFDLEGQTAQG